MLGNDLKHLKLRHLLNKDILCSDANSNIVFQTLKAFFYNDLLINEYFERLIYKKLK